MCKTLVSADSRSLVKLNAAASRFRSGERDRNIAHLAQCRRTATQRDATRRQYYNGSIHQGVRLAWMCVRARAWVGGWLGRSAVGCTHLPASAPSVRVPLSARTFLRHGRRGHLPARFTYIGGPFGGTMCNCRGEVLAMLASSSRCASSALVLTSPLPPPAQSLQTAIKTRLARERRLGATARI